MPNQKIPQYLNKDQVDALLAHAPHRRCEILILLQWRAGLRVSEALGIRYADISFRPPTLRVRSGKNGKERIVPLHPELRSALRWTPQARRHAATPLIGASRQSAWNWVKKSYEKAVAANDMPAGLNVGTHTLRHSFARHCIANGVKINQLQIWLGHAYLNTTLVYLALIPDPDGFMQKID